MIHKEEVENYNGSLEQLANELVDLTYNSLSFFLSQLSAKLEKDSIADEKRGRKKLSENLRKTSENLKDSANEISKAWGICRSHMSSQVDLSKEFRDIEEENESKEYFNAEMDPEIWVAKYGHLIICGDERRYEFYDKEFETWIHKAFHLLHTQQTDNMRKKHLTPEEIKKIYEQEG